MPRFEVVRSASGAASLKVKLKKGESVKAESDALVVKTEHVDIGSNMDGGLLGGLARNFLTGESLFFQTLVATAGDDNEVLLAAGELGDVALLDLSARTGAVLLQQGAFLAADSQVDITSTMQKSIGKVMSSGTGLFILQAQGSGTLAISSYGGVHTFNLKPGEKISVDNGHLVAWSSGVGFRMGMASSTVYRSVTSGEGMMCHFTGPGQVYVSTHKKPPPTRTDKHGNQVEVSGPGGQLVGCCLAFLFIMVFLGMFGFFAYMMIFHPDQIEWGDNGASFHSSNHKPQGRIGGRQGRY